MFLGIDFTNWNVIEKYLRWIFLVVFLLKMTSWACFEGSVLKGFFYLFPLGRY